MEALNELIKLITKKRVKKVELFDESSRNKTSNYFKLFDGIHNRRYVSDEEAASDIYQCGPTEKKYLILKTRLKQKLLNTLFFLDLENDDDVPAYKNALYECSKSLYCARILMVNGSKRIAVPSVEKTLRRAEEFVLTDIELDCARILRGYYSTNNRYKEFVHYRALVESLEDRQRIENAAESYYQEVVATYAKSKANRLKVRDMAQAYAEAVAATVPRLPSTKLRMNHYRLRMLACQFADDYRGAALVADELDAFVAQAPHFHPRARRQEIAIQKMNFLLHLKDYEEGTAHAKRSLATMRAGSGNWFALQEYYLLLAMHCGQYLRAAEVFQSVLEQPSFRLLSEVRRERWKTFQAYLHYVYKTSKIRNIRGIIQNPRTGFRLSKYLGVVPPFDKQRRGLNIAILTVQTLFYLEKYDMEQVAVRVEAIEKYARRYPKKDINFRSECFIGLLTNMRQQEFRFYQTRKHSERAHEEMQAIPMEYLGGNRALEVLPYEVMWEAVLGKLRVYKYG